MKNIVVLASVLAFASAAYAGKAFYKRESISGMNKICYYKHARGEVAITIKATKICPKTIEL